MKYKFSLLFVLVALIMTSCVKDNSDEGILNTGDDGAVPYVTDVVNGFFDLLDQNASAGFTVNTSTFGDVSVSSIDVMKSFNGGAAVKHSTLSGSTGSLLASVSDVVSGLGVDQSALALGDAFTFTFVLNTADGRALTSPEKVVVPMSCVSSLAGTYSVTTTYGFHDYLADYPSNTTTAEIVEVSGGVYSVADFSGGLYAADGPYGINYGTTGLALEFRDVCNEISWEGQSDPWGACIPAVGGTNSVDAATGVITVSWHCEGYGENGVSVYTPQ